MLTARWCFISLLSLAVVLFILMHRHLDSVREFTPTTNLVIDRPLVRIDNSLGNIPKIYLEDWNQRKHLKKGCLKYPKLFQLAVVNDIWQYQYLASNRTELHLFNAYLDERDWLGERAVIRILVLYSQFNAVNTTLYCQVWFANSDPLIVKSLKFDWIWLEGWKGYSSPFHPYVVSCPIPRNASPISVSLVEKDCSHATNNLAVNVRRNSGRKRDFAVCVKGLNFPEVDLSTRLVEWLELLKLLGADLVNFYEFSTHENVKKVLNFYAAQGFVKLNSLTLVGKVSNKPILQNKYLKELAVERRMQEVIPYNDCFYKNFNDFKYIVLLDIDELIMPLIGNWHTLMNSTSVSQHDCYIANNVYFFNALSNNQDVEDVPPYMHMLKHVYRSAEHTRPGYYVKGFHNTESVVALHNHFPLKCIGQYCYCHNFKTTVVQLQHYREDCVKAVDCKNFKENTVMDSRIWRFKEALVPRVRNALIQLGLITDYSDKDI